MAVLQCDFYSETLEVGTSMTVILPQEVESQIGVTSTDHVPAEPPLLYLLHGLSDDHTAWLRNTSIDRYAALHGLAVVMPRVQRSFYADEVHGARFWTFLSQELPRLVGSFFHVSDRREDTFVAGLSMGGYGALKWALREPSRFAAAASLSGALDVVGLSRAPDRRELFDRVYDGVPAHDDDLFALVEKVPREALPALHISCGTEDPLFESNTRFASAARDAGASLQTDFRTGEHEWGFWDNGIQDVLAWLPLGLTGDGSKR
jgi:putative tributyrin esterase